MKNTPDHTGPACLVTQDAPWVAVNHVLFDRKRQGF